jgi:Zn-finger nucleic acid-binding protein
MNCGNCGAAMTPVAGRDYFRCDYCLSFHFPEAAGGDGVRVVGGPTGCDCPVCDRPLADGRVEGEPVHYCGRCRGFLATNPAFNTILRNRRAKRPAGETDHAFCPTELRRRLACPRCRRRMDAHPFYGGGRVCVDTCAGCTLIWLDAGELTVLERHNPARPGVLTVVVPAAAAPTGEPPDGLAALLGWRITPW